MTDAQRSDTIAYAGNPQSVRPALSLWTDLPAARKHFNKRTDAERFTLMAVGDVVRLEVLFERTDATFYGMVVLNYRQETPIIQSDPALDLVNAFITEAQDSIVNPMHLGIRVRGYRARGVTDPTIGRDQVLAVPVPGEQGGEAYDWAMGLKMIWRTGLIGRSFQGRSTFPTTSETVVTSGGLLDVTFRGGAQVAYSACINLPAAATHAEWQLGVLSRFSDGVERPSPLFTAITTGELSPRLGILRQRRD